jgi:hypothetical protein
MGSESDDKQPEGGRDEKVPASRREPPVPDAIDDARVRSAWRSWLSALATDAEAAIAAAFAYESLQPEGRDAWLDALESDARTLSVPSMALYAPLLAVESDDARRRRIEVAIASDPYPSAIPPREVRALRGVARDGIHACVVVEPLYLAFVRVLSCRYTPAGGFVAVKHDPLRSEDDLEQLRELDGVAVEPTPLHVVVEELAHAILADKRERRTIPADVASFAHLFVPQLSDGEGADLLAP